LGGWGGVCGGFDEKKRKQLPFRTDAERKEEKYFR